MNEWSLSTGSQYLGFYPELDARVDRTIDMSRFASRGEVAYQYLFDSVQLRSWNIPLRYVSSQDRQILLEWFEADARLELSPGYTSETFQVSIAGRGFPLSKVERPYDDQWAGILELEEVSPLCSGVCRDIDIDASLMVADTIVSSAGSSGPPATPPPTSWTLQSTGDSPYGLDHQDARWENSRFYATGFDASGIATIDVSCDNGVTWSTVISSQNFVHWFIESDTIIAALFDGYMEWHGVDSDTQTQDYYPDGGLAYSSIYRHASGSLMAIRAQRAIYNLPYPSFVPIFDELGNSITPDELVWISDTVLGGGVGDLYIANTASPSGGYTRVATANNALLSGGIWVKGIAEGDGKMVAITHNQAATSTDSGDTWVVTVSSADGYYQLRGVKYREGQFSVFVTSRNAGVLYSSTADSGGWVLSDPDPADPNLTVFGHQYNGATGDILLSARTLVSGVRVHQDWWSGSS